MAKLENELDVAQGELKTLEAKQAELEKAKREAVAAMNSTQTNATDYRKELDGQRTDILERPRRIATPISRRSCG